MDSLEEGKEMQRQTLYLQSIAASLLVVSENTLGVASEEDRMNRRRAKRAYLAASGGEDGYAAELEREVARLEARVKTLHDHDGENLVHVSREEYDAWSEFWVSSWDAVEVKESATQEATLRYTAAFGRLERLVGMPDEHRVAPEVTA